jgi:hypothetical protein
MERMWSGDARMKYPKQWIIMVNVEDELETETKAYKTVGDIFLVTPDKNEAYNKVEELGESMGESFVFKGFDDTPRIGGIRWNQLA